MAKGAGTTRKSTSSAPKGISGGGKSEIKHDFNLDSAYAFNYNLSYRVSSVLSEAPITSEVTYNDTKQNYLDIGYGYKAKVVKTVNDDGLAKVEVMMQDLDGEKFSIGEAVIGKYTSKIGKMKDSELKPYARRAIQEAQSTFNGTSRKANEPRWLDDYLKKNKK